MESERQKLLFVCSDFDQKRLDLFYPLTKLPYFVPVHIHPQTRIELSSLFTAERLWLKIIRRIEYPRWFKINQKPVVTRSVTGDGKPPLRNNMRSAISLPLTARALDGESLLVIVGRP
jgi:hypothetical protein